MTDELTAAQLAEPENREALIDALVKLQISYNEAYAQQFGKNPFDFEALEADARKHFGEGLESAEKAMETQMEVTMMVNFMKLENCQAAEAVRQIADSFISQETNVYGLELKPDFTTGSVAALLDGKQIALMYPMENEMITSVFPCRKEMYYSTCAREAERIAVSYFGGKQKQHDSRDDIFFDPNEIFISKETKDDDGNLCMTLKAGHISRDADYDVMVDVYAVYAAKWKGGNFKLAKPVSQDDAYLLTDSFDKLPIVMSPDVRAAVQVAAEHLAESYESRHSHARKYKATRFDRGIELL